MNEAEMIVSRDASIQESLYPELTCFGCGHANPRGLHLRSYREGELTVATFGALPEHDNGFGFVNGGIIATLLDCHGAAAVMSEVVSRGWTGPDGTPAPFVTASFEVKFRRPTPLGCAIRLTASPESVDAGQIIVRSAMAIDDRETAAMTATWVRFRPR
jgi:acyl-coenzyme A thioesterase PaaI-like protein